MEHMDYDRQASDFLYLHSMEIKAAFKGDRCPPWEVSDGCVHGDRYRVTIKRFASCHAPSGTCYKEIRSWQSTRSVSFDFWNSQRDKAKGTGLSDYDVLAAISSEAGMPTDPDEVYAEFGEMKPSQARAIAKFAERLQAFFTESEQEQLAEIQ